MRVLHDRILIKPTPADKVRCGLELLSQDQEEKAEGTVVMVGHGVPLHDIRLNISGDLDANTGAILKEIVELIEKGRAMQVKEGDYVLYGKYAGTKVNFNDEEHILIREGDVFMIL